MDIRRYKNGKVVIAGAGATGASVARFLDRLGIAWVMADARGTFGQTSQGVEADAVTAHWYPLTADILCAGDIVILSPGIPRAHEAVRAAIARDIPVVGDIELFAYEVQAPVIAVTGSNGKSTVVAWLQSVLQSLGIDAVACGNIGEPALDSLESTAAVYVLELSSYQLESTESLVPLAATVLNVSDDHLDRYDSIEHYAAVKRRIYKHSHHVVHSIDDALATPKNDEASDSAVHSAFTARDWQSLPETAVFASVFARQSDAANDGDQLVHCNTAQNSETVETLLAAADLPLPGQHNLANALAVLALIEPLIGHQELDVELAAAAQALATFKGLPHRTELVGEINGVRWYNDSKGTNVDACRKAVEAVAGPVILIAGGIGKGADFSALREPVSHNVRALILLGRDRQLLADALANLAPIHYVESLSEAVALASNIAEAGDTVLLSPACASQDMFDNYMARGDAFRSLVQEVLAA